jgi:hypothetical protein
MEKNFRTPAGKYSYIHPVTTSRTARVIGALVETESFVDLGAILDQMNTYAKKILITTESHEMFIIRRSDEVSVRGFCSECGGEVELLTFDSAVSRTGFGGRDLMHRSQAGEIHTVDSASGHLLICARSLEDK